MKALEGEATGREQEHLLSSIVHRKREQLPANFTGVSWERWEQVVNARSGLLLSEAEALERIGWASAQTWAAINLQWYKRHPRTT